MEGSKPTGNHGALGPQVSLTHLVSREAWGARFLSSVVAGPDTDTATSPRGQQMSEKCQHSWNSGRFPGSLNHSSNGPCPIALPTPLE